MIRKVLRWVSSRYFVINSSFEMALASSLGLFMGMLPLIGIRIPMIMLISLAFKLNIIAIIAGMSLTIIFPILHVISFYISEKLSGLHGNFFDFQYLHFSHLLKWTSIVQYHLLGEIITGFCLGAVAFPLFRWFYAWSQNTILEGSRREFIFYDATGRRWNSIKRISVIYTLILAVVILVFGISISTNPFLPGLGLKDIRKANSIVPLPDRIVNKTSSSILRWEEKRYSTFQLGFKKHQRPQALGRKQSKKVFAFYVDWDENSLVSLRNNIRSINVVVPNWYSLNSDLTLRNEAVSSVDELIKGNKIQEMPLINNYLGNNWNGDLVHKIITSQQKSEFLINELVAEIKSHKYSGINLDFESIDAKDRKALTAFTQKLTKKFHSNGLQVSMDVPANDNAFDYAALSNSVDYMIVMLYDEHYESGTPGPIASDSWFQNTLDRLNIPAEKLIVGLGNYGYDWTIHGKGPADSVTYGDVMDMVNEYNLKIKWDDNENNPYVKYKDGDEQHIIWMLDGATVYNELKYALDDGIDGAAIWRLGSEDPSIWYLLKDIDHIKNNVQHLGKLVSPQPVHYSGDGEVLRIVSQGRNGKRSFEFDRNGYITDESYDSYPIPFEVERFGKPKSKEVVLTFDDGPDPTYTPKILDILKKYNIKADFFVVGENAEANPDLIEREYKEGHELGNHTFTHPNVADISPSRAKMELTTTERLIQEITGRSMLMFRPPYVADAEPSTPNELLPILRAQGLGYTMIGELIDPSDWEQPSSDEILRRVMTDLPSGNVILLHDAGGNRINTVKALPKIIDTLKDKGYKFVTISSLIGKDRNGVMPILKNGDNPFMLYDKTVFTILFDWHRIIEYLFYLAIALGIFRFLFLIYFSNKQRKNKNKGDFSSDFKPFVSVVIAAYNEEKVICKTINSILDSNYDNLEILVVNDGSSDNTSYEVMEKFRDNPKVRLINKENGGKSSAINLGYSESVGEIIVALDADTIIAKNAISLLIRHFIDEKVAAVSGNVKVGNVHNLLTLWQHVEYVTGFNLERRAFAELNCITVVPGAIGAWRKSAVAEVGYFKDDTLAEDTDITLALLQRGYKIFFEEFAYAYTESPSDLKSLLKQRYRWAYGTLQCLWKHRGALFSRSHKSLGYIALPNMWLFQYLFQTVSPLADIYFIIGLFGKSTYRVILFYIAFLILDYVASIYAFSLEEEDPKPLTMLFIQRVVYRQFMTYAVLKSIFSALRGAAVGWNKFQRRGNVEKLDEIV